MILLAIQAGCPDDTVRNLLAVVGFVFVIFVVGIGLAAAWEIWGDRVRGMLEERRR